MRTITIAVTFLLLGSVPALAQTDDAQTDGGERVKELDMTGEDVEGDPERGADDIFGDPDDPGSESLIEVRKNFDAELFESVDQI